MMATVIATPCARPNLSMLCTFLPKKGLQWQVRRVDIREWFVAGGYKLFAVYDKGRLCFSNSLHPLLRVYNYRPAHPVN